MLWNALAIGLRDFHIKVLGEYTIPTELRIYMIHIRERHPTDSIVIQDHLIK